VPLLSRHSERPNRAAQTLVADDYGSSVPRRARRSHRHGEAVVIVPWTSALDPSVLVKQRHYQPRDGRSTEVTDFAVLDSAGRRRSPATLPGFHAGRAPRNKGMLYPTDPPTVEEIVCVMRHAREDPHGFRLRAMIVMLWRGGLRVPGGARAQRARP
jgi:hypothetical protein